MAIITTKYSIGWFGTTNEAGGDGCDPFNLTEQIGTYIMKDSGDQKVKEFVKGNSIRDEYLEEDLKGIVIFGYTAAGAPQIWSLEKEENAFWGNLAILGDKANTPNRSSIVFTKNVDGDAILACGRMYVIINNNNVEVDIPGFIPSADGVDMGRIDTTITG